MTGIADEDTVSADTVGGLDGIHHLWCVSCHPDWLTKTRPGPDLTEPFIAVCGAQAVILARWQDDALPPGTCPACAAAATCTVGHP